MGSRSFSCSCLFLVVLGLVLNVAVLCNGGKTSSFVRPVEKTIDMPLDSDVFRVPPGYNAPQQVSSSFQFSATEEIVLYFPFGILEMGFGNF